MCIRDSFHDFRVVFGQEQINLIFDLVVPYSYTEQEEDRLVQQVTALMQEVDSRYQCVITVDRSYLAEDVYKRQLPASRSKREPGATYTSQPMTGLIPASFAAL